MFNVRVLFPASDGNISRGAGQPSPHIAQVAAQATAEVHEVAVAESRDAQCGAGAWFLLGPAEHEGLGEAGREVQQWLLLSQALPGRGPFQLVRAISTAPGSASGTHRAMGNWGRSPDCEPIAICAIQPQAPSSPPQPNGGSRACAKLAQLLHVQRWLVTGLRTRLSPHFKVQSALHLACASHALVANAIECPWAGERGHKAHGALTKKLAMHLDSWPMRSRRC
ncbi:hypothetical protein FH972_021088 [Carpinus fangiana]|uniref:Uncharacterized protein n=1 Tax=Carpinus fangiana TaxID=176857 RepID=A0A5N6KNW5_9ROSI|nr:hypothetical protein FH972_021088 [Carpinus fangiana]